MNWLLVFVPVAIALEFLAPERYLLVFAASCLGIVPLAGWLGQATEQLAERLGEGVGGLLNATGLPYRPDTAPSPNASSFTVVRNSSR